MQPTFSLSDPVWLIIAFGLGVGARLIGLPPMVGYLVAGFGLAALGFQSSGLLEGIADLGMTLMLGLGYFFVGLGVLHAILRGRPIVLTALYLSLVLSWPALMVAALGLVEQWVDLRRRVASPH